MSIPQSNHKTTTLIPDRATPDPETKPADPLQQAETLLARFAAGGWLLTRGGGGNGTQADNRAVLDAAVMIALGYEIRVSAEMIVSELSRVAAALEARS